MFTEQSPLQPSADPQRSLEQAFMDEFLRAHGYDATTLNALPSPEREQVMTDAVAYASGRLSEVECRAHFVHEIHGAQLGRTPPVR